MLKARILTATVLIILVLAGIFYLPQAFFAAICALIIWVAAWEWAPLFGWTSPLKRALYIGFIILGMLAILPFPPNLIIGIGAFWWFLIIIYLVYLRWRHKEALPSMPRWLIAIAGLFSLVPCWLALLILHQMNPALLLIMLVMVWTTDIVAFFGGRAWGKNKLAPLISPNKTMEGAQTALSALLILGLIGTGWVWHITGQVNLFWIKMSVATFLAATAGDLFESLLKRQSQIKDTGQLLPGHGGLLDRIDSLLAAAPVFTLFVLFQS